MSNHQPYPGDDDPGMGDHLSRLYSALAGDAARHGHLDIEQTIKRVRRRRAAKATAITASTLVLVAALGAGAWAQPWQWQNTPTPPATQTPTPSNTPIPSPTPSQTPTPTDNPPGSTPSTTPDTSPGPATRVGVPAGRSALDDPRFQDGQLLPDDTPGYPAGWVCGAPVADVLAATSTDGLKIETVGDPNVMANDPPYHAAMVEIPGRITDTSGQGLPQGYTAGSGARILWTQQGQIVGGFGWAYGNESPGFPLQADRNVPGETRDGLVTSIGPGESVGQGAADVLSAWTCGTKVPNPNEPPGLPANTPGDRAATYPDTLPSGTYTVYLIEWYTLDGTNPRTIATGPVTVVVP